MRHADGSWRWYNTNAVPLKDETGKVVGFEGSASDITERKRVEVELEEERSRLQQALDDVRTLRGIVPICANCKKIRDDQGYWNQVEKYISDHTEAKFSHGICPDCMKELYPELYVDKSDNTVNLTLLAETYIYNTILHPDNEEEVYEAAIDWFDQWKDKDKYNN